MFQHKVVVQLSIKQKRRLSSGGAQGRESSIVLDVDGRGVVAGTVVAAVATAFTTETTALTATVATAAEAAAGGFLEALLNFNDNLLLALLLGLLGRLGFLHRPVSLVLPLIPTLSVSYLDSEVFRLLLLGEGDSILPLAVVSTFVGLASFRERDLEGLVGLLSQVFVQSLYLLLRLSSFLNGLLSTSGVLGGGSVVGTAYVMVVVVSSCRLATGVSRSLPVTPALSLSLFSTLTPQLRQFRGGPNPASPSFRCRCAFTCLSNSAK